MTDRRRIHINLGDMELVFRPSDLRVIRAMTGRSLSEMAQDADNDADRWSAHAFVQLRRDEPDTAAKVLWDQIEDADLIITNDAMDPTISGTSTGLPLSAGTGVAYPEI